MNAGDAQTIAEALAKGPLAALPLEVRRQIAAHARCKAFAQGETLFREGEPHADLLLLLRGLVKLCRHSPQGKECVFHVVRPGRAVDVGALFHNEGLPCSAVAIKEGAVLKIERRAVLDSLRSAPLALPLLEALSVRQRLFINKIAGSQGRISVPGRVASWLLHRARMEKSATLCLSVTQETLARQMGISRESLSRELSALAAAGLIDRDRRRITLLDAESLRSRAES